MSEADVDAVAVVYDAEIIGVLTRADLLRAYEVRRQARR